MKQTFTIPEGCKAISMEQVGNQIVTTFEPEFKRGDVLIYPITDVLCVFKRYTNLDEFESYTNSIKATNLDWVAACFRHATPEEAQRLWDALAKEGKRWNPKTMEVEPIRWRAKFGKDYYCFYWDMSVVTDTEDGHNSDNVRYNSSNYFRTKEQAERVKAHIQKAFKDFWKEELK